MRDVRCCLCYFCWFGSLCRGRGRAGGAVQYTAAITAHRYGGGWGRRGTARPGQSMRMWAGDVSPAPRGGADALLPVVPLAVYCAVLCPAGPHDGSRIHMGPLEAAQPRRQRGDGSDVDNRAVAVARASWGAGRRTVVEWWGAHTAQSCKGLSLSHCPEVTWPSRHSTCRPGMPQSGRES